MPDRLLSFSDPRPDLNDASILVTGGTGSFGQAFVRYLVESYAPKRVVIYSRDELKQYEMAQSLSDTQYPFLRYFIGDVRDADRLEMAMRGIDVVVHAAALKHVPAAEYNPFECIRTNVQGAENVVKSALRCGVGRVISLSTDKAANPINLYGASKLASDKIFVAANNLAGDAGSRFSVVRYGNVIGSRGSVVPFFRKLIREGAKSLPITDPRMTRFWITVTQGVAFVLSSLAMMQGGEIYVPRIPSMRVQDIAKTLAPDLPLTVIGIRPGEKLHEVMITEDDARATLSFPDRFVIQPTLNPSWHNESYLCKGAKPVADDFRYASDSNDQWLDGPKLLKMLASVDGSQLGE
jgi:UDP-N-acetylglucosamine 4,6-dehydratase